MNLAEIATIECLITVSARRRADFRLPRLIKTRGQMFLMGFKSLSLVQESLGQR